MATRSNIAMQTEDGKFLQVYSHWDGYPSYNGLILLNHYNEAEKIAELISYGGISSLAPEIRPNGLQKQSWDADKKIKGVCLFYSDRGDEEPVEVLQEPSCDNEWLYVWMKKEGYLTPAWYYAHHSWKAGVYSLLTHETCVDGRTQWAMTPPIE